MNFVRCVVAIIAAALWTGASLAEDLKQVRVAVLKFGTVNWELDTIGHHGFDTRNGFELDVRGVAGGAAGKIAFQGGEADVIVSDWLWVARQRAEGKDYVFLPYSRAVGGLLVPSDSPARSLSDLAGQKIGIAGGPLDKSWLILKAYAQRVEGFDLAVETEQVFGAPPLIFKTALSGDLGGAINFWHFMAKMEAGGMRNLISTSEAATALGLDTETPLLGYVFHGDYVRANLDVVAGFAAASRAAKDLLAADDAEWERLRPRMNARTNAQFAGLIEGFRAGIPVPGPVDETSAAMMFELMADLGGKKLVGDAETLPVGVFLRPGS